jgi:hypothetical protein
MSEHKRFVAVGMLVLAFVLALRIAVTSAEGFAAAATPTLQDVLGQIAQATSGIGSAATGTASASPAAGAAAAAHPGAAAAAHPFAAVVRTEVATLKSRAGWLEYLASPEFWFPNFYSIITIIFLVAAGVVVSRKK